MRNTWLLAVLVAGVAFGQDKGDPEKALKAAEEMRTKWNRKAEDLGLSGGSLWGLTGVHVAVEVDREVEEAGLTKEAIMNAVELRLRANSVPVHTEQEFMEDPAGALLVVTITAVPESGAFTGWAELGLFQSMWARRSLPPPHGPAECTGLHVDGTTWRTNGMLYKAPSSKVLERIALLADRFSLAYLKAKV
jgi:hypothetical protein